jgi:hypothetical protein
MNIWDRHKKYLFKTLAIKEAFKKVHALKMASSRVTKIEDIAQEFVFYHRTSIQSQGMSNAWRLVM